MLFIPPAATWRPGFRPSGRPRCGQLRTLARARSLLRCYDTTMRPTCTTVAIGKHTVQIERLEKLRWRVPVDGRRFAIFCTESRARAAGRLEARRLDYAVRRPADAIRSPRDESLRGPGAA